MNLVEKWSHQIPLVTWGWSLFPSASPSHEDTQCSPLSQSPGVLRGVCLSESPPAVVLTSPPLRGLRSSPFSFDSFSGCQSTSVYLSSTGFDWDLGSRGDLHQRAASSWRVTLNAHLLPHLRAPTVSRGSSLTRASPEPPPHSLLPYLSPFLPI